jgi:hypothetical protein
MLIFGLVFGEGPRTGFGAELRAGPESEAFIDGLEKMTYEDGARLFTVERVDQCPGGGSDSAALILRVGRHPGLFPRARLGGGGWSSR